MTSAMLVGSIMLLIFLPIILTRSAATGNIRAFNRNGNSGARASFDDLILEKKDGEKVSSNVVETAGAAIMQTRVSANKNAIGYVSAGQLIDYPNSDKNLPDDPNALD
jgi:ABC-type phosphate transport system substrate-binding protein